MITDKHEAFGCAGQTQLVIPDARKTQRELTKSNLSLTGQNSCNINLESSRKWQLKNDVQLKWTSFCGDKQSSGTLLTFTSDVNWKFSFDLAEWTQCWTPDKFVYFQLFRLHPCWPYMLTLLPVSRVMHSKVWVIPTAEWGWFCISQLWCEVICWGKTHMSYCAWKPRCVCCGPDFHTLCGPASRGEEKKRNLTLHQQNRRVYSLESRWSTDLWETHTQRGRESREIVSFMLSDLREPMAGQIFPGRRVSQKRWVSKCEQGCNHYVNSRMI